MGASNRPILAAFLAFIASSGAFAIVNGVVDESRDAVGAVIMENGDTTAVCSGVLIEPSWVLTAAHCMVDFDEAYFCNADNYTSASPADMIPFDEVFVHPGYDTETGENDIALIRLSRPVTSATPIPVLRTAASLGVGSEIEYVGYGLTSEFDTGNTARNSCVNTVSEISDWTFMTDYEGHGPSSGDSGGPAILVVGGAPFVAGIIASGGVSLDSPTRCARASAYAGFIDSAIPGNLPPSAPALISPEQAGVDIGSPTTFTWRPSVDPENGDVEYTLCISEDASFEGAEEIDAGRNSELLAIPAALALLATRRRGIGDRSQGKSARRKAIAAAILACAAIIAGAGMMASCGNSPSAPPTKAEKLVSYEKTDLIAGKTYYWKVIAIDSAGYQAESETRSFTLR